MAKIAKIAAGTDTRAVWRKFNELIGIIEDLQKQVYILQHPNNRRVQNAGGGGALPIEHYDPSESWSPGDRVVVYPTDTLVTTGILDEETEELRKAPAGIYCCIKAASPVPIDPEADPIVYRYNVPKWPTETADDIEATNTYWWLEALYPTLVTKCVENPEDIGGDLIEQEFYENTQPVPETEE